MLRTALLSLSILVLPAMPATAHGAGGGVGGAATGGSAGSHAGALTVGNFGLQSIPGTSPLGGYVRPDAHPSAGYPFFGVWGGFGGEMSPELQYAILGYPPLGYYAAEIPTAPGQPRRVAIRPVPRVEVSNQLPATLYLQLPAAGEIWVNGERSLDKPTSEWTLTSPNIRRDQSYTFDVKVRWHADGKAYEYARKVSVASGNSSRVTVLSGTPITTSDSISPVTALSEPLAR